MKLNYATNAKDPVYRIAKSVRVNGVIKTVIVKEIGRHSELAKTHDDPLAYAKQEVAKYNEMLKSQKVPITMEIDFNEKLKDQNLEYSKSTVVNIGYFFLQCVYQELDLKKWFGDISKGTRIKYDPDLINRFLTFARVLDPKSKYSTFDDLDTYYENPDFSYQDIMRYMTLLEKNYDGYLEYLLNQSNKIVDRDFSVCYYDCTNVYFETEQDDKDYTDEITGEYIPGFRKYGVSKEHRPNPIVEMGLFMDSKGIPITMCLHPGNTSEQITAVPLEKKLVKALQGKELIYCADAGLGSANIRLFNDMGGRAFVVTQSIKKLSNVLKQAVFNDYDYKLLSDDSKVSIESLKSFDKTNPDNLHLYNDIAYKVITADNAVDLGLYEEKHLKNGKVRMVKSKAELKQKIIITFSRKYFEYQRAIRNDQIDRAKKLLSLKDPEEIKKGPNDIRRFIKRKGKNADDEYYLDEQTIADEEKYDGYYAVATNLNDSVQNILAINKQRYKIEECFRIIKTNFKAHPVFHHTEPHIKAHFLMCYTALLIYRLLEVQLNEKGLHHTTTEIIETMKNMNICNNNDAYYTACYTNSSTLQALNLIYPLDLDHKYYTPESLKKKVKKITK